MIYDVAALPEQVMYRTMKEMYNELGTSAPEDMIFMHYPGVGSRGTVLWKDRGRLVAVTIKLVSAHELRDATYEARDLNAAMMENEFLMKTKVKGKRYKNVHQFFTAVKEYKARL